MATPPAGYRTDKVDAFDKYLWEQEVKEIMRGKSNIAKYIQQIYSLFIRQCTDAMMSCTRISPTFTMIEVEFHH